MGARLFSERRESLCAITASDFARSDAPRPFTVADSTPFTTKARRALFSFFRGLDLGPRRHAPDVQNSQFVTREKSVAVRRELRIPAGPAFSGQCEHGLAARQIPYFQGFIRCAAHGEAASVRRKSNRMRGAQETSERRAFLQSGQIPQPDESGVEWDRQQFAVK